MIFPPAFLIFSSAILEHAATVMVRGFVIVPVPRSLEYPRLVRFTWLFSAVSWSSCLMLSVISLRLRLCGELNPCLPK